jgi:uncharacterized coiled-coil protein SlyX
MSSTPPAAANPVEPTSGPNEAASSTPGSRFVFDAEAVFADDPSWDAGPSVNAQQEALPTAAAQPQWTMQQPGGQQQAPSPGDASFSGGAPQAVTAVAESAVAQADWSFSPQLAPLTNTSLASTNPGSFGRGGSSSRGGLGTTPPHLIAQRHSSAVGQQQQQVFADPAAAGGGCLGASELPVAPFAVAATTVSSGGASQHHAQSHTNGHNQPQSSSSCPGSVPSTHPGTTPSPLGHHGIHSASENTSPNAFGHGQQQQHHHPADGSSPAGDTLADAAAAAAAAAVSGGAREGEVQVYTSGFDRVLNLPRKAIKHLPPANLNVTRLVICTNYDPRAAAPDQTCPMGDRCKFVHADVAASRDHPIHVNYAWRSLEEVTYERYPPGEALTVAAPNSKMASEVYEPHTLLKTRALASSRRPLSHCAHYHFNRTCNLGHECRFVHAVFVDPNAKEHQRAPIATIRHQMKSQDPSPPGARPTMPQQQQQQQQQTPSPHATGLPPAAHVALAQQQQQQQQQTFMLPMQQQQQQQQHQQFGNQSPAWQMATTPSEGNPSLAGSRRHSQSLSNSQTRRASEQRASPLGGFAGADPQQTIAQLTRQLAEQKAQLEAQQAQYNALMQVVLSMQQQQQTPSPSHTPPTMHSHQRSASNNNTSHQQHQHQHQPQSYIQVMTANGPMLVPANSITQQQQQQQFAPMSISLPGQVVQHQVGGTNSSQQFQQHQQQQQQPLHAHFAPGTEFNASPVTFSGQGSPPHANSRRTSVAISLPPQSPRGHEQ